MGRGNSSEGGGAHVIEDRVDGEAEQPAGHAAWGGRRATARLSAAPRRGWQGSRGDRGYCTLYAPPPLLLFSLPLTLLYSLCPPPPSYSSRYHSPYCTLYAPPPPSYSSRYHSPYCTLYAPPPPTLLATTHPTVLSMPPPPPPTLLATTHPTVLSMPPPLLLFSLPLTLLYSLCPPPSYSSRYHSPYCTLYGAPRRPPRARAAGRSARRRRVRARGPRRRRGGGAGRGRWWGCCRGRGRGETCPLSTGGGTRRVQLVRGGGGEGGGRATARSAGGEGGRGGGGAERDRRGGGWHEGPVAPRRGRGATPAPADRKGTRRVQLVRRAGRDVSTWACTRYGRGAARCPGAWQRRRR